MKYLYLFFLSIGFLVTSCNGSGDSSTENANDVDSLAPFDSLKFFNDQVAMNPNSSDWRYKRALFLLGKGNLPEAKLDMEQGIRLDSLNFEIRLLYGNLHLSLTNLDTSRFHYEYIIKRDTMNTGALIGMSKIYALLNNSATADMYLSKALRINPNLAEAYFMRGLIYRSDYYETGREESWERSLSSFQTTVEQDPDYYSAYVAMGVMYDQKKSDLALDYYNAALDVFPESQEALYNVGMFHQTRGNNEEALVAYRTLNKIDSTWADPYYNQGYIHLLNTENLDSAIYFFTVATQLDPQYYQAYNNLGLAYETKGDLENARKNYTKAVEANPDFKLAKDNLNRLKR